MSTDARNFYEAATEMFRRATLQIMPDGVRTQNSFSEFLKVLIGQQHLVQIFRDDELLVLEVREPRTTVCHGVQQGRKDLTESDGHLPV
mgnify:CR=1 FL=1